jgi:5-amino-6-(5-phosphoribosylamino)uracil reductase
MTEPSFVAIPERPFVTLNVALSADGKLAPVDGGKVSFGGAEDRAQMELLRAEADGVLIGGGTLRVEDPPLVIRDPELRGRRVAAKGSPHPRNIAVCSVLPENLERMNFFRSPDTDKLVFTTERTPRGLLEGAKRYVQVEVVPAHESGRVNLVEVLRRLVAMGVGHLLLEGGGELNFSMLQAGLIDEIYMTICPFIFGGRTAPTPFDGAGFGRDSVCKLSLVSHRVGLRGEIFVRYRIMRGTPPTVTPSLSFVHGFEIS